MAKNSTDVEVVEYDEKDGRHRRVENDEGVEMETFTSDNVPETVVALDPSGEEVEIALSEPYRRDLAYEVAEPPEVEELGDWPGKEEDAELARQHHELGIDNQLIDPTERRDDV